jgi:hypothetical protein
MQALMAGHVYTGRSRIKAIAATTFLASTVWTVIPGDRLQGDALAHSSRLGPPVAERLRQGVTSPVSPERMKAIYEEVKTPYKHRIVIEPPAGKKVDCPAVFRHDGKCYMVYVQLEPAPLQGYTTQLAESTDLLHWKPLGTILPRGPDGAWDHANAGGGVALFDTTWGGSAELQKFAGRYWLSYLGGKGFGYEVAPLHIGLASTDDPSKPTAWSKVGSPILSSTDADAREGESGTLYKSYIFKDESQSLGAPFVMFYNATPLTGSEKIFAAVSDDLRTWRRIGAEAVLENPVPPGSAQNVISGDPQVVRIGNEWVMFYFGAFWKPGAFDTFAASKDLLHWTKWTGEDLIRPSEPYDAVFAHKPWLIKHDGVVYHFYTAVSDTKDQHRAIAVATSKPVADRH